MSVPGAIARRMSRLLLALAARTAPRESRDWAAAMTAEAGCPMSAPEQVGWAVGCASAIWRSGLRIRRIQRTAVRAAGLVYLIALVTFVLVTAAAFRALYAPGAEASSILSAAYREFLTDSGRLMAVAVGAWAAAVGLCWRGWWRGPAALAVGAGVTLIALSFLPWIRFPFDQYAAPAAWVFANGMLLAGTWVLVGMTVRIVSRSRCPGDAVLPMAAVAAGLASVPVFCSGSDAQERPSVIGTAVPAFTDAIGLGRKVCLRRMDDLDAPGFSVAVGVGDRLVWSEGFGCVDVSKSVQVRPDTPFRIASVSKVLTATVVGRLHERGLIDLDAPVQTYVPSFPDKGHVITIRQLAGHQAGIRSRQTDAEVLNTAQFGTVTEALGLFRDDPLDFPPGTRWEYSSLGYVLLGAAIEGAARDSFTAVVRREITDPLRMDHTIAANWLPATAETVVYYERAGGGLHEVPRYNLSSKWPSGGYLSTPEDLVRLGLACFRDDFLKPETVSMMFTPQRTEGGEEAIVGIGWHVVRDPRGRAVVFHTGGGVGYRSALILFPAEELAIALTANAAGGTAPPPPVEGMLAAIDAFIASARP